MKTVCMAMAAFAVFVLAPLEASRLSGQTAETGSDKKPEAKSTGKRLGKADVTGMIHSVSADGKLVTVALPPTATGDEKENTTDVKLNDKTRIVFTSVGPGEARVRKGYFIRAWLAGSKKTASRVHLASTTTASGHAPSLAGLVTAVAADGKSMTILLAEKSKEEKEEIATVKITDKTEVTFTHVPAHGARVKKGMRCLVWLADGSQEVAARARFYGSAERYTPGAVSDPSFSGILTRAAEGSMTVEVSPKKKGQKPSEVTIKVGDSTEVVYRNVAPGAAVPKLGYSATVWRDNAKEGSAKKVVLVGLADTKRVLLIGRVWDVAEDGKTFTLMLAPKTKGEEGTSLTIKLADRARIIYHGVGVDGAQPRKGYGARVWLAEGSKESAAMVVFEGRAG